MSQVYFIDGQQLGPENFGFTDPLTNTWRPKKYTAILNFFHFTGVFAPFSASGLVYKCWNSSRALELSNSPNGGKVLNGGSGGC